MKQDAELKCCPFCGHEASMTQHESAGGDGRMIWIVGCNSEDCEVSFQGHARKCDAAKDWNARTIDPQLLELCENDEELEILATKNRDGLFTRFLITRAKGDAWPKTPCSKCGHRFHEKECHTSLVSSRGSVACDCAGYDHAAAELRWIPVSERLPELGDCYMTTQDLEDGEGVMSWPLHYESKTKKWFQDIDHKEPFDHPVLAWQERPKPYTEPADNIGEELHVIDYATGNCNLGCCKGEPECSHPMAERVGLCHPLTAVRNASNAAW